jgi:hypothetical protein
MNERHESGGFRHGIYWYVLITAVVQSSCGILGEITSQLRGQIAVPYFIILFNFALLLHSISPTLYPTAIIAGTFFTFLIILAIGEIHQIGKIIPRKSIPPDPLEEARRHATQCQSSKRVKNEMKKLREGYG